MSAPKQLRSTARAVQKASRAAQGVAAHHPGSAHMCHITALGEQCAQTRLGGGAQRRGHAATRTAPPPHYRLDAASGRKGARYTVCCTLRPGSGHRGTGGRRGGAGPNCKLSCSAAGGRGPHGCCEHGARGPGV